MNQETYEALKRLVIVLRKDVNWYTVAEKKLRIEDLEAIEGWIEEVKKEYN